MSSYLPHEKLKTYSICVDFAHALLPRVEDWPSYAVKRQIERAIESILVNVATGAQKRETGRGMYHLECAMGSVLESAACLDVARRKDCINESGVHDGKSQLQEAARMMVSLRQSWGNSVKENPASYENEPQRYFAHESLDVYNRALSICAQLHTDLIPREDISSRWKRKIDKSSTSMALNVAEGNGRFSKRDQAKFIAEAQTSCATLASQLDIIAASAAPNIQPTKQLIRRVSAMLAGMANYLDSE